TSRRDPETGFFAVKKYVADARDVEGEHRWIKLVSLHPDKETYPDILLKPEDEDSVRIIARFVASLGPVRASHSVADAGVSEPSAALSPLDVPPGTPHRAALRAGSDSHRPAQSGGLEQALGPEE